MRADHAESQAAPVVHSTSPPPDGDTLLQGELLQEGKGGDGDGDHDLEGVGACAKGGGGPGFRCTWASAPVDHDEGLSDSINLCRQDHMEVELHAPAIDADDRTNRTNRSREG